MADRARESARGVASAPLCDLGLIAENVVDTHQLSLEAYVRHVDADLPRHPLLVRGHADDVASLVASAIECVARWPGVNRRIVVSARLVGERVELLVVHGSTASVHPSVPMSLDELGRCGDASFESLRQHMLRLLMRLGATLVAGRDAALDGLALSIVFPGVSGAPLHRPYRKSSGGRPS